jgi:hypothetical protein
MSKLARRAWLISSVLLLCAAGSCYVGDWQYRKEAERLEKWAEAGGPFASHFTPDTNIWQPLGVVLFLVGVSVAVAACMLRSRDAG